MTLNYVMATILCYFTDFGSVAFGANYVTVVEVKAHYVTLQKNVAQRT